MHPSGQFSFDLGEPPRIQRTKVVPRRGQALYFAALPDPEIANLTASLTWDQSRRNGLSREPRQHDLYHASIYPIDIASRSREEAIFAAMQAASTIHLPSFELIFDRVATFSNGNSRQYVLWCRQGNIGLKILRQELATAMQSLGFDSDVLDNFAPHMTLFYCRRALPEVMLEKPIVWTVKTFTLVNSFQGEGEHGHVWHWSLF